MPLAQRRAETVWEGNLVNGKGVLSTGSGVLKDQPVTWAARTERPDGKTSPEELIAAAQASCYAMALSHTLAQKGTPPERLHVTAICSLDRPGGKTTITEMEIQVRGWVPGLSAQDFEQIALEAEKGCPVANALRNNVKIGVQAKLES